MGVTSVVWLVEGYGAAKNGCDRPEGRMVAVIGDGEVDGGNIFECLQEGRKRGIRDCWWFIDYNRQSLDGIVHEGL